MTGQESIGTHQKALQINLDAAKYGTFAEIGAGQEVARWFFRVGGAAGTIAKSMSAYDMTISDAIYGKSDRYVSRERLGKMLEYEFQLMLERLDAKRGENTKFFVFSDTVAAKSFKGTGDCHGWLGIRFQDSPRSAASEIIIHVRMLDRENLQQQEALGIIGVNLIYGALYYHSDSTKLITSLMDDLTRERVEVDMIKATGPAFKGADNRVLSLQLVQQGLTSAAMFTANGEVVQAADVLYKKPILVERGSFRPVTHVTMDMLHCAQAQFVQEPGVAGEEVVVLMEMTLKNLEDQGTINYQDFLDRVDILGTLGKTVLISNYLEFYKLAAYLHRYTKKMIGIALGVPTLREIFDEKYYVDLEGGILESFGRLFKNDLKVYAYPLQDHATRSVITAGNLRVAPNLRHLYEYLQQNHFIQGMRDTNEKYLPIFSRTVLKQLKAGDPAWETAVPPQVAKIIKERKLLGYPGNPLTGSSSAAIIAA
ncbi:MAG: TonB-dependent receptor [Verrucomicrobia bacterium]|nr:TonB-dependent receptor [Verrucomicrobiota bacterium]